MNCQSQSSASNDMTAGMRPRVQPNGRLQGRVVLLINGLCRSGQVLAGLLSQQGSDVAVVDPRSNEELACRIKQDVALHGRRCLILADGSRRTTGTTPQSLIQEIVDTFGRLDAFISFADPEAESCVKRINHPPRSRPEALLFDRAGLTKAALNHLLARKSPQSRCL